MISDYKSLISALNYAGKRVVSNTFWLDKSENEGTRRIIYHSNGDYYAVNRVDCNNKAEVKVSEWFGDYYIYVEVRFLTSGKVFRKTQKSELSQCLIWMSIFKKLSSDITQLFRVEWDDYGESDYSHPQPHWHITLSKAQARNFKESLGEEENDGFYGLLSDQEERVFQLFEKFHFAMVGNWEDEHPGYVSMTTNEQIVHWFEWILSSIRKELEYIN